jgi:hypothetical protein
VRCTDAERERCTDAERFDRARDLRGRIDLVPIDPRDDCVALQRDERVRPGDGVHPGELGHGGGEIPSAVLADPLGRLEIVNGRQRERQQIALHYCLGDVPKVGEIVGEPRLAGAREVDPLVLVQVTRAARCNCARVVQSLGRHRRGRARRHAVRVRGFEDTTGRPGRSIYGIWQVITPYTEPTMLEFRIWKARSPGLCEDRA